MNRHVASPPRPPSQSHLKAGERRCAAGVGAADARTEDAGRLFLAALAGGREPGKKEGRGGEGGERS